MTDNKKILRNDLLVVAAGALFIIFSSSFHHLSVYDSLFKAFPGALDAF